jgi:hypothetical protein
MLLRAPLLLLLLPSLLVLPSLPSLLLSTLRRSPAPRPSPLRGLRS